MTIVKISMQNWEDVGIEAGWLKFANNRSDKMRAIRLLRRSPKGVWNLLSDVLKNDPEIQEAKKQGWISYVTKHPQQAWRAPEDIRMLPEVNDIAQKVLQGWKEKILAGIEPIAYSMKCPSPLKRALEKDPQVSNIVMSLSQQGAEVIRNRLMPAVERKTL